MIFHEDGLRHLVAEVGVDHIFYGTDYPFDWPVGIDFVLNATFLSNAQKEAILGNSREAPPNHPVTLSPLSGAIGYRSAWRWSRGPAVQSRVRS